MSGIIKVTMNDFLEALYKVKPAFDALLSCSGSSAIPILLQLLF